MVLNNYAIGQFRQTVVFMANTATTSATTIREAVTTGGKNDNYSILLTTRGRLRKSNGSRGLSFGLVADDETYELVCRFQTALEASLRTDTKIIIDSKTYTPQSWEKVDQLNHIYIFRIAAIQT